MILAFDLPSAAYELIVDQLEANLIERARWSEQQGFGVVPSLAMDGERALRAARPVDGVWRVTCDTDCARLAGWFDEMANVVKATSRNYSDPALLVRISGDAARSIRASLAAVCDSDFGRAS